MEQLCCNHVEEQVIYNSAHLTHPYIAALGRIFFQLQYIWYSHGVQNDLTLLLQLMEIWTTLALIELWMWIRLKYFVTGLFKTKYLSKDKVRQTYVNISPMWDMRLS